MGDFPDLLQAFRKGQRTLDEFRYVEADKAQRHHLNQAASVRSVSYMISTLLTS
jgi:hypothetical protein